MNPPHGLAELQARYGALVLDRHPAGGYYIVTPTGWEVANMQLVRSPLLPTGKLFVNKDMVQPLLRALAAVGVACPDYKVRTIGCWSVRYKRTVRGDVSVHAWGLAVDINADTNPLAAELITDMPEAFVSAFEAEGFTWGGKFSGQKDAMHFQWVSGY